MRKHYLDNIRWFTVALVVVYHVLFMYNGEGVLGGVGKITRLSAQYYDVFLYAVYPWFMLILFMVSGICSRYYLERHTSREFARNRTTKLLVPSSIGLFAFQFLQGYVNMSIGGAFDTPWDAPAVIKYLVMSIIGTGVLWYIQMLWLFSMALLLIRKLEQDRLWAIGAKTNVAGLLLLTSVIWGSAQIFNMPVVIVYRFGLYGAAFLLGYFVFSHDEVTAVLKQYFPLMLALAVSLGTAFCAAYFGRNYADAPVNRSVLFTCFAWFACLAILGGAARYADFETPFTAWMSRHNFGLYVFHYLGVSSSALFLGKLETIPAPLAYCGSLLAGFAAGYLLNAVISRLPFFKWVVLGIAD